MIRGSGSWCGCEARVAVAVAGGRISSASCGGLRVIGVHCGRQTVAVVNFGNGGELFDQLKLRLARKEASILRGIISPCNMKDQLHISAVASQALRDKSSTLFRDVCVNPKVLSPEAVEFMLSVAASQGILTPDESEGASHADLILRGVHPSNFGPVLLVCTTTMFAAPVEKLDVEKAQRRAELWKKAVGPSFTILSVVAGYELPPEIADFAKDGGVFSCDISK